MKFNIKEFFQESGGKNSSKRLISIISGVEFNLLCFIGAIVFLYRNDTISFIEILQILGLFSSGGLTLSVFDTFLKRKNKAK